MTVLGQVTMPVTRQAPGNWTANPGYWTDGVAGPSAFNIIARVQPITPELVEDLPEGSRTSARFVMYAEAGQPLLITVDIGEARRPDRLVYAGRTYTVQSIGDWSAHVNGLPHQELVMLQVGDDE